MRNLPLKHAASFVAAALLLHGCGNSKQHSDGSDPNCGVNCAACNATNHQQCFQCVIGFQLHNGKCGYTCTCTGTQPSRCGSQLFWTKNMDQKGISIDDTTLRYCPGSIPISWPVTNDETIKSIRLFKGWQKDWNDWPQQKEDSWENLRKWVQGLNVSVFYGTTISCKEEDDDQDWEDVKQLMKIIGTQHAMGLSIGNELELLHQKPDIPKDCIKHLWSDGYIWRKFQQRMSDLDSMGLSGLKVTSVMSTFALDSQPFTNDPKTALVLDFLTNATSAYGSRYTYSLNVYGYFNTGAKPDESGSWDGAIKFAKELQDYTGGQSYFANTLIDMRKRMKKVSPAANGLWVTETGWSWPRAHTLDPATYPQAKYKGWSTVDNMRDYYENFLHYDLQLPQGYEGPDHIFYFTTRDSRNFNEVEHFGLIGGGDEAYWCTNSTCKLNKPRKLFTADVDLDVF